MGGVQPKEPVGGHCVPAWGARRGEQAQCAALEVLGDGQHAWTRCRGEGGGPCSGWGGGPCECVGWGAGCPRAGDGRSGGWCVCASIGGGKGRGRSTGRDVG